MTDSLLDLLGRDPINTWAVGGGLLVLAAALVLAAVVVHVKSRRTTTPGRPGRAADRLTILVAAIATAAVSTGMWRVFGEVLHITNPVVRVPLFAVFELALVICGMRARQTLRQTIELARTDPTVRPTSGVDGIAVWVFAGLAGVFTALDSRTLLEASVRLTLPVAAAWLWERGLTPERRSAGAAGRRWWQRLHWRATPERVLVWLRLAEPSDRSVDEVDRTRRLARLAVARARAHYLRERGASRMRVWWAERRLDRQRRSADENLGLAGREEIRHEFLVHLAAIYQFRESTTPAAVADLTPWSGRPKSKPVERQTTTCLDQPAPRATTKTDRRGQTKSASTTPELVWSPRIRQMAQEIGEAYPDHVPSRLQVMKDPRFAGRTGWSSSQYIDKAIKCLAADRDGGGTSRPDQESDDPEERAS